MCGYGRLLVPLAEAGFNIHGVDRSSSMLAQCESRLSDAALAAPLCRQDVAELNLPFRYGAVHIAGGAFQALSDTAVARAALVRIRAHLIDPASILIDFHIPPDSVQRIAAPLVEFRSAMLSDGSRIALRSETTMQPEARLALSECRYVHRAGAARLAEEHETRVRAWYSRDDAAALIAEAGYRDIAIGPPAQPVEEGDAFSVSARA